MLVPIRLIAKSVDYLTDKFIDAPGTNNQKSITLSVILFGILLAILFLIRFWPPSDAELAQLNGGGGGGGVSVNFGDTDFGSGADYKSQELDVKNQARPTPVASTPDENIISEDNNDDVVAVPKHETPKNTPKPVVKDNTPKPVVAPKPVVRKTDDALANILHGNTKGGDGNSHSSGNQGRADGDINSNGYSGSGGSGGGTGGGHGTGNGTGSGAGSGSGSGGGNGSGIGNGSGYSLGGRKALTKPSPAYNCNEEGKVVVQITVDKNGNVTDAKPGARGTTNAASCLLVQARLAAMNTKWEPSPDGTEKQVGSIVYNFKLRD